MIAAAMGDPALQQLDLAEAVRRRRHVAREVAPQALPRLQAAAQVLNSVVVDCEFLRGASGVPELIGSARAYARLPCQRCEEAVEREIVAQFQLALMDEAAARALEEERDVRVVDQSSVDLLEIIEDELLLNLPAKVCERVDCEHMPAMEFAPDEEQLASAPAKENPFAVLAALKDAGSDTSEQ